MDDGRTDVLDAQATESVFETTLIEGDESVVTAELDAVLNVFATFIEDEADAGCAQLAEASDAHGA